MNLKARLYNILLLWSPSDERQQTDHYTSWEWADFYLTKSFKDMDVSSNTHRNIPTEETASEFRFFFKKSLLNLSLTWVSQDVSHRETTVNTTMTVIDFTDTNAR